MTNYHIGQVVLVNRGTDGWVEAIYYGAPPRISGPYASVQYVMQKYQPGEYSLVALRNMKPKESGGGAG